MPWQAALEKAKRQKKKKKKKRKQSLKSLNVEVSYDPAIPVLGIYIYLREMKTEPLTKT